LQFGAPGAHGQPIKQANAIGRGDYQGISRGHHISPF
jgi:hypothetical protein